MKPPLDTRRRPKKVAKRPPVVLGVDMATGSDFTAIVSRLPYAATVNTADVEAPNIVRDWNGDVRTALQRAIDHTAWMQTEAWLRAMAEEMVVHVKEYRDTFVGAGLAVRTPPRRTTQVCRPNLMMVNDLRWSLAHDNNPGCPPEPHDQKVWEAYGRMASRVYSSCPLAAAAGGRPWYGPLCDELTGVDQRDPEALMYGGNCGGPPIDLVTTEPPADEMEVRGLLDWDVPEINYVERMGAAGRFFESYVDGEWIDVGLDPAIVGR